MYVCVYGCRLCFTLHSVTYSLGERLCNKRMAACIGMCGLPPSIFLHFHSMVYGLGGRLVYSGLCAPIQWPGDLACPYLRSGHLPSKRRPSSIPLLQQPACLASSGACCDPLFIRASPFDQGTKPRRLFGSFPYHQAGEQSTPRPPGQRWEG